MTIKNSLAIGTLIDNYRIEKTLGAGGFSIVYVARDLENEKLVAIKEYMPQRLATRGPDGVVTPQGDNAEHLFNLGRNLFLHEARALATLKHPNIVEVTNFFSANDTIYMVMSYEKGVNLQKYIKEHNGGMSEKFIRTIFPPLLSGLEHIHSKGLLHLDIKPGNIHIRPGGRPILLDFGAIHQQQLSRQHQTNQVVSPGFSPCEQSQPGGYVGPWTDLYAIGATIRACIEGHPPAPAAERVYEDKLKPLAVTHRKLYSRALLEAIDWAMEPDPLLRPQSVAEFLAAMDEDKPEKDTDQGSGQEAIMDWISNNLTKIRSMRRKRDK